MFAQIWQELWIPLFVVLIVIGVTAGQGLVIGFGAMGLVVVGISRLWNRVSLEEVSYERHLSDDRAFIGDEISMTVTLTNKKPIPLGTVEIEDEIPKSIEIADGHVVASPIPNSQTLRHSTSMAWYERIRWEHRMKCTQRGLYRIGPARIQSGDLFGFFSSGKTVANDDYLLVYPRVVPLSELGLPAARPLGEVGGGIKIFPDPSRPSGIREYQPGDPLKTIDWKASARRQSLQVRTFEPSSTMTVLLVVVVETTPVHWAGYLPASLERVVTAAASVASYASERQYSLGLFSNGPPILADRPMRIPPTRSPEQLTAILEALATIRPLPLGPMSAQLEEHARNFPLGATLVVIAALISAELVETIGNLKAKGYRIVVLYVGEGSCPQMPEGVMVRQLNDHFERMELACEFGLR